MKYFLVSILFILGCAHKQQPQFRAIGHRGAAGHAPENTLAALEAAKKLGVKEIEIDVQLSKDEEIVLFHDKELNPKTQLQGKVGQHKWSELMKADLAGWYLSQTKKANSFSDTRIVNLDDVFKKYGSSFYYHIEIKSDDEKLPELLLKKIQAYQLMSGVQITSFYFQQLQKVRELNSEIRLTYLIRSKDIPAEIKKAKSAKMNEVAIAAADIEVTHVSTSKYLGLAIRGYGVKDRADLKKLVNSGVYGSTLDHPEWIFRQ